MTLSSHGGLGHLEPHGAAATSGPQRPRGRAGGDGLGCPPGLDFERALSPTIAVMSTTRLKVLVTGGTSGLGLAMASAIAPQSTVERAASKSTFSPRDPQLHPTVARGTRFKGLQCFLRASNRRARSRDRVPSHART